MAEMIPDRLPGKASRGGQHLFQALQKLPDDVLVYYEPVVELRYPDFIIVLPDRGLLVIEVKGWYLADIVQADTHNVVVRHRGRDEAHKHPARQARDYMNNLRDACAAHPSAAALLQATGAYQGRFTFPFGHFVVLSNITRPQLSDPANEELARVFADGRTMCRDELLALVEGGADHVKTELERRFDTTWLFPRLSSAQVDVLRSILHPFTRITPLLPLNEHGQDLKVLDLRQERNALSIGSGHRVIYGVAGAGKTILLIARVRLLAREAHQRVLVLCFNKVLARWLAATLRDCSTATVRHFHGWAAGHGIVFQQDEDAEALGSRLCRHLEQGAGDARSYDAVMIDEAQDFACSWFQAAKLALKEPDDGDLLIVGDGSQSLYRARGFTWAEAGVHAQGRVLNRRLDLDRNYRNTAEILTAARSFGTVATAPTDEAMLGMPIDAASAERRGPAPLVVRGKNRLDEIEIAADVIARWLTNGVELMGRTIPVAARDIGVLYARLTNSDRPSMQRLRDLLGDRHIKSVLLAGDDADGEPGTDAVHICTIHSAKGLQFRAVIVIWADQLPSGFPNSDEQRERRLLYVALTRAEEVLVITHSGSSTFIDEINANLAPLTYS